MKEISDDCERFIAFPSGHIYLRKQGGLDSSLIVAVASRYLEEMEGAYQWGSQLHSFCIGLEISQLQEKLMIIFQLVIMSLHSLFRPGSVGWDQLCSHKDQGGLGFRNISLWNQAAVGKLA
ncbi:asparagine synthetase [glutamine-hydrolyzing] 2 isoform X2 [Spinacia oleracea]|nr:asparagine synthetase [glutamine-hydrolyzing] 2-like isoform X2 [Spinacia oleracea]